MWCVQWVRRRAQGGGRVLGRWSAVWLGWAHLGWNQTEGLTCASVERGLWVEGAICGACAASQEEQAGRTAADMKTEGCARPGARKVVGTAHLSWPWASEAPTLVFLLHEMGKYDLTLFPNSHLHCAYFSPAGQEGSSASGVNRRPSGSSGGGEGSSRAISSCRTGTSSFPGNGAVLVTALTEKVQKPAYITHFLPVMVHFLCQFG